MKQKKLNFFPNAEKAVGGGLFRLENPSSFEASYLLKTSRNRGNL